MRASRRVSAIVPFSALLIPLDCVRASDIFIDFVPFHLRSSARIPTVVKPSRVTLLEWPNLPSPGSVLNIFLNCSLACRNIRDVRVKWSDPSHRRALGLAPQRLPCGDREYLPPSLRR